MDKLSLYLFAAALITLVLAAVTYFVYTVARRPGVGAFASLFIWMGVAFLGLCLVFRSLATGHAPYTNMYEFSLSFAFASVAAYTVFETRWRLRSLGLFVLPVAIALLLYAATLPKTIEPLVPALQADEILTVHVACGIIAYGTFSIAFVAGLLYLIQGEGRRIRWLPDGGTLDDVGWKAVSIGFPVLAANLILGAYWASKAWGRYWGWDPKETAALVTWLIYGVYLHMRSRKSWAGRPSALVLLVGFVATLFTFFGVNLWISSLHSYSGL